jgi:hypothetical protein
VQRGLLQWRKLCPRHRGERLRQERIVRQLHEQRRRSLLRERRLRLQRGE